MIPVKNRLDQAIKLIRIILAHRIKDSEITPQFRVLFDFEDHALLKRHLISYAYCLDRSGASVAFSFRARFFLRNIEDIDDELIRLPFFHVEYFPFITCRLFKYTAVVTNTYSHAEKVRKKVLSKITQKCAPTVSTLMDSAQAATDTELQFRPPLTIGPRYLFSDRIFSSESISPLSVDRLKHRIIFFGNCSTKHHGADSALSKTEILRRPKIVALLVQMFPNDVDLLTTHEDQERFRKFSSTKPIVIFDASGAGLFDQEYWATLRESAFFLAMPGIASIHTHSLAEAMSAGCCPLVQDAASLHAEFSHGVNCLSFCGEQGLTDLIQFVLAAKEDAINLWRQGSYKLYRRRFSPTAVGSDLTTAFRNEIPVQLYNV